MYRVLFPLWDYILYSKITEENLSRNVQNVLFS